MAADSDPNRLNTSLYVGDLSPSVTETVLKEFFMAIGTIKNARICRDTTSQESLGYGYVNFKTHESGYGFVHFATEDAYNSARHFLHKYKIEGTKKEIYAGPFIPKSERKSLHDPNTFNNCFVKNFGDALDDEKLESLFSPYGKIISCVVMKDESGNSKGFGFVCYETSESAQAACDALHNMDLEGNTLYVGKAIKKEKRLEEVRKKQEMIRQERKTKYGGCVNLYVKNLDPTVEDKDLHDSFCKFGEITSAKVMKHEDGKSKGFGFVCFKEADSAAKAVSEMKKSVLGNKPLYVAIAQRKEDRQSKLYELFKNRDDVSNMVPQAGFYGGSFAQNQKFFPNTVISNRRGINQMMQQISANQLNSAQYPGGGSAMQQFNHFSGMRHQIPLNRSGVPGLQAIQTGGLGPGNMRPRTNLSAYNPGQQMTNRLVSSINASLRTANPSANTNVQYNQNARNVAVPQMAEENKTRLGNKLMPIVNNYYPECAGKLTGILLSMDPNRLEKLFEDPEELKGQIDEAYNRLRKHEENSKKSEVK